MNESRRPFAVVTGASSGIGLELARQFARHGYDLLIAAQHSRIHEAARELSASGTQVDSLEADLATYGGVEKLWRRIQDEGRPLDAIAINAGIGVSGDFAMGTSLEDELRLISLNVIFTVHLAKRVLPVMLSEGRGKILFTTSIAGAMSSPFEAVYGASQAFLTSFAQAIRGELQNKPVSITVLMPGASEKDDPAVVAREGFEALMAGKDHVVAGSFRTRVQAPAGQVLPDPVVAGMHRGQSDPGSAGNH